MQHLSLAQETPQLIYIGDPMCSWCYGFAPELSAALEELEDKVDVQLIMGGLRPYNHERIDGMKDFLKEHWEHVHEASDQEFNYDILNDPTFIYDTEPPSRAVLAVRLLKPAVELPFFKDVQVLFYKENKYTHLVESYLPLLEKYSIDPAAFKKAFESDELKQLTRADFEKAADLGIRGFPSVVLMQDDKYSLISNGYIKAADLVSKVKTLVQQP